MNYNSILNKALLSNNIPNLLLYGHYDIDKKNILTKCFSKNFNILNNTKIEINDIKYSKNNIYYDFDLKNINNKNYNSFIKIIKELILSKDYYSNNSKKIIILNNYYLSKKNQNILRVIIEKYQSTSIFIIITHNYSSIIEPIKSRCLSIRIPTLKRENKRKIMYQKISYKDINKSFYDVIYDINNIEMIKDIIDIKNIYDKGYKNIYEMICENIISICEKSKLTKNNYNLLRDISYNITKNNLNILYFYRVFLKILLKKTTIMDKIKIKLIYLLTESEYNYIKSYRKIIIIESLIFNIYNLLAR